MRKKYVGLFAAMFAVLGVGSLHAAPVSGEIELVHQLGDDQGKQLEKLVERFNAQSKAQKILVSDRDWKGNGLPPLLLLKPSEEERFLAGKRRYKPLWQVMKDAGEPLEVSSTARMVVPTAIDSNRRLLALPVGLGSPVMFYNATALQQAGIDTQTLPTTWLGWQDVLGKLTKNHACPYTTTQPVSIFVENVSAWHNQPYTVGGKKEQLAINGLMQVKHLAMMASWHKSRYLHTFGQEDEAEDKFIEGHCVVMSAPSSAYPSLVRRAKFDVGVTYFPYHDGAYGAPQNTLADGPNLWVAAGRTAAEYKAIAKFVSFWLTPESQVQWQVDAGYLPLNRAGALASGSALLKDDLLPQKIALDQLMRKPPTSASTATAYVRRPGVRRIIGEELDALWADKKPAKQALDDAVARVRAGQAR